MPTSSGADLSAPGKGGDRVAQNEVPMYRLPLLILLYVGEIAANSLHRSVLYSASTVALAPNTSGLEDKLVRAAAAIASSNLCLGTGMTEDDGKEGL